MKPTLLIDADLIVYRIACACEKRFQFGDEVAISYDEKGAVEALERFVQELLAKFHPEKVVMCFTGKRNFRYTVLPEYKSNRKDKEKPKLFHYLKEYCESEYPCFEEPTLEADDILGILGSSDTNRYIVCSGDKDLKSVPCVLYNFLTNTVEAIDTFMANHWFFYQTLLGDTTDCYKGCPQIGKKKAEAFLQECYTEYGDYYIGEDSLNEYIWKRVVEKYEATSEVQAMKAYGVYPLTREIALQQARVARILRDGEYDFNTKEIKLWRSEDAIV